VAKQLNMASVENCTCFNVRRISRAITQFFDAEAGRYGIRPTQTPILGALQAKDGWGMAELSEWLGMERTTLVRNLRRLQRTVWCGQKAAAAAASFSLRLRKRGARPGQNASRVALRPGQGGCDPGQRSMVCHHRRFGGRGEEVEEVITASMTMKPWTF
jgi:hypothetical protein